MEVSVIVTVRNEASSIEQLLEALAAQTVQPAEIVIVDGGSTDQTVELLRTAAKKMHKKCPQLVLQKNGNRSVGRNTAIAAAKSDWIAITDAGCVPKHTWLSELLRAQKKSGALVVAGYYTAQPKTPFEQAVVPYALVMPDRVDSGSFLPATRSMLVHRDAWKAVGGFDERLSDNEDYVFARALRARRLPMSFARAAIVVWQPRQTLREFAWMIFRFARGDIHAGILRPKVALIFVRYVLALTVLSALLSSGELRPALLFFSTGIIGYTAWSIYKNVRYVATGWYWLPILQLTSDAAVVLGSLAGGWQRINSQ